MITLIHNLSIVPEYLKNPYARLDRREMGRVLIQ
jgi:hypothetical protein